MAASIERRLEEETREALEATQEPAETTGHNLAFDYGVWLNFRYINYHDDDKDSSLPDTVDFTRWLDSRLWFKLIIQPALDDPLQKGFSFYLRLKNIYSESRPKETAGGSDNDGTHLEYAYATLELPRAWITLGRNYFSVGQGIAYSNVHDGILINYFEPAWRAKLFYAHTLPHENNIDESVPGYDKGSDRHFWGIEGTYTGFTGHRLYGYTVIQRDYSDQRPQDPAHNYSYNSEYFGLGGRGTFMQSLFSYWWEAIKETGKSTVYATGEKRDIDAWAGIFALAYAPRIYSHPSLYFKYAFGSGDKDRSSVTDTLNGNTIGKDTNFLYFGYLPTGYALSPQLSNLHFIKTGFTLQPLEKNAFFKKLMLGFDYYRYYKDKSAAGIYDPAATNNNSIIGDEFDATLSWQVCSDLSFKLQYGHFIPNDAYPTGDSEDYLSISTSITF
ncbi:MAG: alginate export family protein [Candidatus Omnitrophota bacterium]